MKRFILFCLALVGLFAAMPAQAHDHIGLSIGLGGGCCYGGGYYNPYYYQPYYAAPVYYPPVPPAVVYVAPPAPVYAAPQYVQAPTYAPAPAAAPVEQTAPPPAKDGDYTDAQGRICRRFQSSMDGAPIYGTACQQPDGSWRTVQ